MAHGTCPCGHPGYTTCSYTTYSLLGRVAHRCIAVLIISTVAIRQAFRQAIVGMDVCTQLQTELDTVCRPPQSHLPERLLTVQSRQLGKEMYSALHYINHKHDYLPFAGQQRPMYGSPYA